jgi:hypothetical protein
MSIVFEAVNVEVNVRVTVFDGVDEAAEVAVLEGVKEVVNVAVVVGAGVLIVVSVRVMEGVEVGVFAETVVPPPKSSKLELGPPHESNPK